MERSPPDGAPARTHEVRARGCTPSNSVTITWNVEIDVGSATKYASVPAAHGGVFWMLPVRCRQVENEAADDGKGIPEDTMERISVPFFTTKASGSGIGPGLSRQIIRMHGGTLTCRSIPGGRCLRIGYKTSTLSHLRTNDIPGITSRCENQRGQENSWSIRFRGDA
jgi:hypothetical protein